MKIFSTFTGIGGFEVGICNAFEATRLLQRINHQDSETANNQSISSEPLFIGYSEIDKYATSVYEKHFPGVKNYGDITKINGKELPDFDCLVGGFPCQAFSIAGKRGGFSDTRGTLFFDLARILREKQPRLFVFENVKGLLGHDRGRTFKTIVTTLYELGYDVQWQVLNSKNFDVPQNRERIIIVGHLRGTTRPKVFPITGSNQEAAFGTVTSSYHKGGHTGSYVNEAKTAESESIQQERVKSDSKHPDGGEPHPKVRRLTPLECERLQAFPDNWTKLGVGEWVDDRSRKTFVEISDSQRYKMCGNAVTTNVIQAVFERIFSND